MARHKERLIQKHTQTWTWKPKVTGNKLQSLDILVYNVLNHKKLSKLS